MGTAWGFAVNYEDRWIIALPGVPRELRALTEGAVIHFLKDRFPQTTSQELRVLKTFGLKESEVNALLKDILKAHPSTGLMVRDHGEVHVRLCGPPKEVNDLAKEAKKRLGYYLYGEGEDTLEKVVGHLLKEKGLTVSTAESCTGGMLAHTITNVPGSSDYFWGGFITYTDDIKHKLLGVPLEVLKHHTAISPETAQCMVEGLVKRTGTDVGISVTGIAGPTGGSTEKPVGLVYIGYHFPQGTEVVEYRFQADRPGVKTLAVKSALDHVRKVLSRRG